MTWPPNGDGEALGEDVREVNHGTVIVFPKQSLTLGVLGFNFHCYVSGRRRKYGYSQHFLGLECVCAHVRQHHKRANSKVFGLKPLLGLQQQESPL